MVNQDTIPNIEGMCIQCPHLLSKHTLELNVDLGDCWALIFVFNHEYDVDYAHIFLTYSCHYSS